MKGKIKWKNLIILIVLVFLLIIGCIYTYKKTNNSNVSKEDKYIYPKENDPDAIVLEASDLLLKSNIDLNTNFSNQKLKYNKMPYEIECTDFDANSVKNSAEYACKKVQMSVLNYSFTLPTKIDSCSEKHYLIWKNNYFVYQYVANCTGGCGFIYVSKDDNIIFKRKNVTAAPIIPNSTELNPIRLKNDDLYYYVNENGEISLKKINIKDTNLTENEIKKYQLNKKNSCSYNK